MDAIRKKMHSLKMETEQFNNIIKKHETNTAEQNKIADVHDARIRDVSKKLANIESNFDETIESYNKCLVDLEEKEKTAADAEQDVGALSRRIVLLESEAKDADTRLGQTVYTLAFKSKEADIILKKVRHFESKNMGNESVIEEQEKDLREALVMGSDSEMKLDEITRRIGVMQEELRRTVERADFAEQRISTIEEELRTVGDNMKQLEVSEEKAMSREEKFKEQIRALITRLKAADSRAEYGEMNITKLNHRIDDIEDEIIREKMKIKKVSDELGDTFEDMLSNF